MVGCQHCPEMACEPCQLNYDQAMCQNMRQESSGRARSRRRRKFIAGWFEREVIRPEIRELT